MTIQDVTMREVLLAESYQKEIDALKADIIELRSRLKAAEEALRFIATTDDERKDGSIRMPLSRDGMIAAARFALAKYEGRE